MKSRIEVKSLLNHTLLIKFTFIFFDVLLFFGDTFLLFSRHYSINFWPEYCRGTSLNFGAAACLTARILMFFLDKVQFPFSWCLIFSLNMLVMFIRIWTWGFSLIIENAAHHLHLILFLLEAETESHLSISWSKHKIGQKVTPLS